MAGKSARGRKDEKTIGGRCWTAMSDTMSEKDLLNACGKIGGPKISQQILNQILNDQRKASKYTPIIAAALNVHPLWLAYGIGPMREEKGSRGPMSSQDHNDLAFMQAFRELPHHWQFTLRSIVQTVAVSMRASNGQFNRAAEKITAKLIADHPELVDK